MEPLIAVLAMTALLAGGTWFQYRLSKGRMWHPLWLAFSTTSAAILFVVAGGVGYQLERRNALLAANRWAGEVIWWQVGLGAIFAAIAIVAWRIAIRHTDRELRERRRAA